MINFQNKNLRDLHHIIPEKLEISTQLITSVINVISHKHSYYEIFYVVNGSLEHKLNDKKQTLSSGDCILLTPNDIHSMHSSGDSVHRDILVSKELFENQLTLVTQSINSTKRFFTNLKNPVNFSLNELVELENLAQKFATTDETDKKRCIGITLLLSVVSKFLQTEEPNATTSPSVADRVLDCLNQIVYLQGGIPALSNHLKYSASYLCHTFKKQTGIPLSLHIKNLRLDYVVYYLKTTNYSLRKIADIIGIESLPYLNKIFKEKYSVPPITYRKQYKTIEKST